MPTRRSRSFSEILVFAVLAWVRGYWNLIGRLHYSLVALTGLAFVWFLNY